MSALKTLLRWASTIACVILVVSFGLFAIEQAKGGSKQQVNKIEGINQPAPSAQTERQRERTHGTVREAIDDADDVLISPFAGAVHSQSIWAQRGIPALIAFLLFGVGLRIAAAYLPGGGRR